MAKSSIYAKTDPQPPTWEQIRTAVVERNRVKLREYGNSFGKPILHQPDVTIEETIGQLLSMAPGKHPHLGPILLDLADKLSDPSQEWH